MSEDGGKGFWGVTNLFDALLALAQAQQQPDPMAGCTQTMAFLGIIIAIFYFMVIRPQRKQQMEQQRFLDRLKEGDRIITSSGIFGRIVNLDSEVVTVDIGDRTKIRMLRSQVSRFQPGVGEDDKAEDPIEGSDSDDDKGSKKKKK